MDITSAIGNAMLRKRHEKGVKKLSTFSIDVTHPITTRIFPYSAESVVQKASELRFKSVKMCVFHFINPNSLTL